METKKIAGACFVGGALCVAVALAVVPVYWWLGLFAGFIGGYFAYDFRKVFAAIPKAWRTARRFAARDRGVLFARQREWFSTLGPFMRVAMVLVVPFSMWTVFLSLEWLGDSIIFMSDGVSCYVFVTLLLGMGALVWTILSIVAIQLVAVCLYCLAYIGVKVGERGYWWPRLKYWGEMSNEQSIAWLEEKGLQRKLLTYTNVLRWICKGFGIGILFFFWPLWRYLAIGTGKGLCLLGKFFWHAFRLIHSNKRLLCAIDGTLGGAVSYLSLTSSAETVEAQVMITLFGGIIGAGLGIVNWEIVSKRLLHVPTEEP